MVSDYFFQSKIYCYKALSLRFFTILLIVLLPAFRVCSQPRDFQNVSFQKADTIALSYAGHDLKDPGALAEKLVAGLDTDVEKFRAIFRWITDNIAYDVPLLEESEKIDRKFSRHKEKLASKKAKFSKKVYSRMLRKKSSICIGYAMLLEYMSNHVGIECNAITGYGRDDRYRIGSGKVNHAWNVVKLNGKWYTCDATWASGHVDLGVRKFFKDFSETYFLTSPELFIANHFPKDTSWCLLYKKPSLRAFLNAPIKYEGFILNKINYYAPEAGVIKKNLEATVRFEFTSNRKSLRKATIECYENHKYKATSYCTLQQDKEGKYFFDYLLCDTGFLSLWIFIDNRPTFRYDAYISKKN